MFSKELENLIQATIADGQLSEKEKNVLIKRAKNENVDLDELEIYIDSLLQQRRQEKFVQIEKETAAHEKLRKGNVCPHCHTVIPPMTKICPECGRVVNANETSADKELLDLVDRINTTLIRIKAADNSEDFNDARAECEVLLKKAKYFYGEVQKIQMLIFESEEEIKSNAKKVKSSEKQKSLKKFFSSLWFWSVVQLLVGLLVVLTVDLYDYETIFLIGYGIILISVFCFGICARVVKKTAFWIAFLLFTGGSILTLGLVLNYNTMTGIGGVIAGLGVFLGSIKMYDMI